MAKTIRSRDLSRHPLELSLVLVLALSSAFQLTQGPATSPIPSLISPGLRELICIIIIVSAALTLVGAALREPMALYLELAGMLGIGLCLAAYTVIVITLVPNWESTSGGWTTIGIGVGVLVRAGQIIGLIRELLSLSRVLERARP